MKHLYAVSLALILTALLCVPVSGADAVPDYGKILRIHLSYSGDAYSVSSVDVDYGKAPNLNLRGGELSGAILGSNGQELSAFALNRPGVAYGDILGPEGSDSLTGYTARQSAGTMTVTIPYLPDTQAFRLTNPQSGTVLATVDLQEPLNAFCSDYSQDPDCLLRITAAPAAAADKGSLFADKSTSLVLATVFSLSVLSAAALAIWTLRRRAATTGTDKKQTIMVVDDDPEIVSIITTALEKKGFATLTAFNGRECLAALAKQVPDIILLDVLMEPMDGWETLEQIKDTPAYKAVPVLMLTGKKPTPEEAQKYRAKFHDYIMKPFRLEELYAAIDTITEHNRKLQTSLALAKQAGIDKHKVCELADLSLRISVNKKIVEILDIPLAMPAHADLDTLDDMLVVDYINVNT
ncbi:MAG: response regulator, partial [Methanomicrobiales archaeon]|nr:response regulator [Methanomicrobiales archaeon]